MLNLHFSVGELLNREEGASLAEYSLLVTFIAIVCVSAVGLLGEAITRPFTDVLAAF